MDSIQLEASGSRQVIAQHVNSLGAAEARAGQLIARHKGASATAARLRLAKDISASCEEETGRRLLELAEKMRIISKYVVSVVFAAIIFQSLLDYSFVTILTGKGTA